MCLHTLAGTTVHHCQCAVELMCSGVVNYHIGIYWMCWICDFWFGVTVCGSCYTCCGTCAWISCSSWLDHQCAVPWILVDVFRWKVLPGLSHEIFVWHLDLYMYVQRLTVSDSHMFAYIKAHFAVQIPCQLLCLSACWCHLSDEMMKLKDGKVERSESRQAALRSKAWPRHWGKDAGLWPRLTDIGMFDTWDILRFCAPHISTFLRHSCLAKLMSWSVCLPCLLSPRSWFLTVVGTYCEIWYVNISNIIYI